MVLTDHMGEYGKVGHKRLIQERIVVEKDSIKGIMRLLTP